MFDDLDRFLPLGDYVTITRHVPGQQDPQTGVPLPSSETKVFAGAADVQDDTYRLRRSRTGDASVDADAVVYVADVAGIEEGDLVAADFAGTLMKGHVVEVSRFESRILVKWQ